MKTLFSEISFRSLPALVFSGLLLGAWSSSAETLHLKDGQRLEGQVKHYYNGLLSFRTDAGDEKVYGLNELAAIEFQDGSLKGLAAERPTAPPTTGRSPKNESSPESEQLLSKLSRVSDDLKAEFRTPLDTFESWKKAAMDGNVKGIVETYASFRQKAVEKELKGIKNKKLEEMQETTSRTTFIPAQPFYQGDRAVLEVTWQNGMLADTQVLQFILEKDGWKIIQ